MNLAQYDPPRVREKPAAEQGGGAGKGGGSRGAGGVSGVRAPPGPPADDVLRIFVSTDNHLGHKESHEVRGNDSFMAVEEVLKKSVEYHSDFLLLGGDLFDDNKPSRQTMVRTIKMFKKAVLGDREVKVEAVDCSALGDEHEVGVVNWQDENLNIALPTFIIHGNHDDPAGQGHFSALDLLSSSGLLNYFGKQKQMDDVLVKPLLLSKGGVNVAIYGLGNIPDTRLYQTFVQGKVRWDKPQTGTWFHILVIHQNRIAHGATKFIPAEFLPGWLDFVIWGHEHECLIDPREETGREGGKIQISQPGSSVQTSLAAAEAEKKHCAYMDIRVGGDGVMQYRWKKIAYTNVRPFVYREVCLDGSNCGSSEDQVGAFLSELITEMIQEAKESFPDAPPEMQQPLIKLKVEHTGYPTIHIPRFGQKFKGSTRAGKLPSHTDWQVANPEDLITFWRRASRAPREKHKEDTEKDAAASIKQGTELLVAAEIPDLVEEELNKGTQKAGLEVLYKENLFDAVTKFVDKEDSRAIADMLMDSLKAVKDELSKDVGGKDAAGAGLAAFDQEKELQEKIAERLTERQQRQREIAGSQSNASQLLAEERGDGSPRRGGGGDDMEEDHDDDMGGSAKPPPKAKPGPKGGGKPAAGAAASKAAAKAPAKAKGGAAAKASGKQMQLSFTSQQASAAPSQDGQARCQDGQASQRAPRKVAVAAASRRQQLQSDSEEGGGEGELSDDEYGGGKESEEIDLEEDYDSFGEDGSKGKGKKTAKKAPAAKGGKKAGASQPSKKSASKKPDEQDSAAAGGVSQKGAERKRRRGDEEDDEDAEMPTRKASSWAKK